jgi:hypothetical protein
MSLVISKVFTYDTDAGNYIQAVEAADGQALEAGTRQAINNFVVGCKQDGIWSAIKASCILSGARTLSGALQPLVGTAPTNNGFIGLGTDYVRKTGLIGNGSSKYLSTNKTYAQLIQQNSGHISCHVTADTLTSNKAYIGGYEPGGIFRDGDTRINGLLNTSSFGFGSRSDLVLGFLGVRRNNSSNTQFRRAGAEDTSSSTSSSPAGFTVNVFAQSSSLGFYSNARLAFYSIGESLDLALLDARVTALITAFGVAIP